MKNGRLTTDSGSNGAPDTRAASIIIPGLARCCLPGQIQNCRWKVARACASDLTDRKTDLDEIFRLSADPIAGQQIGSLPILT